MKQGRIKMYIGCIVAVLLMTFGVSFQVDVQANAKLEIRLGDANVLPGYECTIPVTVKSAADVNAYDLKIPYDEETFEFVSGKTKLSTVANDFFAKDGKISVTTVLDEKISTDDEIVLFELTFKAKETANVGDYDLSVSDKTFVYENADTTIGYIIRHGHIGIRKFLKGDINVSENVDITDAMLLFHYVSGRNRNLSASQLKAADINNDGFVNIIDAMMTFHYVSGRLDSLGNNEEESEKVTTEGGTPEESTTEEQTTEPSTTEEPTTEPPTTEEPTTEAPTTEPPTTEPPVIFATGVTLNGTSGTLTVGQTVNLIATVAPDNATNKGVTWSSNNTSVASVDGNGKVTANAAGTAIISVRTNDGGHTASYTLTVNNPYISVTGVTLNGTSGTLTVGQTVDLVATVSPNNATDKGVTWSSNNSSVASVDGNGKVTANAAGTAIITVRTNNGGHTASYTLTVNNPHISVTGVSITNKPSEGQKITLDAGKSETFTCNVSVAPSNATNKAVTYTSSNTSIATVDSAGKVMALATGKVTITVTTSDGNRSDSFMIHIYRTNAVHQASWGNNWLNFSLVANSNLAMQVTNSNTYNGAKVILAQKDNNYGQLWQFHDYTSKYGGLAVVPKCNSGSYILDANRGSSFNLPLVENLNIDVWAIGEDNEASMWERVKIWDGSFILKLKSCDFAVGVASATNGAQLILKKFDVTDYNQRWSVAPVEQQVAAPTSYTDKLNALRNTSPFRTGDQWYDSYDGASQCHGWALLVGNRISGRSARTWATSNTLDGVKAGDIIRYQNSSGNGHTIVVTGVSGNNIIFAECNYDYKCSVRWDRTISKSTTSIYGFPFAYRMVAP